MSVSYTLEIDTELGAEELVDRLTQQPGFRRPGTDEPGGACRSIAIGPGLRIVASPADEEDVDLAVRMFGFRPTASVSFIETGRDVPDDIRYPEMVAGVMRLLGATAGDAVLYFEESMVLFQRRDGQVTINTKWDDGQWPDGAKGRGHLRRSIPSAGGEALADL